MGTLTPELRAFLDAQPVGVLAVRINQDGRARGGRWWNGRAVRGRAPSAHLCKKWTRIGSRRERGRTGETSSGARTSGGRAIAQRPFS
jgi:hypothetical protein